MNRIAVLRKKKGLSQARLGEMVGAAQNTVCNWENGNREPDNETLVKLADLFDVPTDYILAKEDDDKPEELLILNRAAKKMSTEQLKKLLDVAKVMFEEEFDD